MPHHPIVKAEGRITDIFAHRFVLESKSGERCLADIGPKDAASLALRIGEEVGIEGEQHPSEIKVSRLSRGGRTVDIHRVPKHGPGPDDADPAIALEAVKSAGAAALGEPMRHPRHFEVLGQKGSSYVEYHVEFDGHIRKEKPVRRDDAKWASVIGQ